MSTFWYLNVKKGSKPSVFYTFDFEICFAPQWRALFWHLNFQKVVRAWCVLYILTWKCASRHNGVQFFSSHLATWLRTRHFSEPTFRPSGATSLEKHYLFARLHLLSSHSSPSLIFSLLLFSSPTLPTSAFHLSILSEVWLLNFLRQLHYTTRHYTALHYNYNYITLH